MKNGEEGKGNRCRKIEGARGTDDGKGREGGRENGVVLCVYGEKDLVKGFSIEME